MPRFVEDRDTWIREVVQSPDLPHLATRVGIYLAMQMTETHRRDAMASIEEIAAAVHASQRGVISALGQLEGQGYLGIERKRHKGNRYWLLSQG
ncbi:hypothetical protein [Sinorhizobium chiapasense]|uniref:HTH marR-type domain-containing protein n=1 Tax=Sinorhizobium chiapasense TaxID=501572 RepID=A0ABZ2BBD3_9HYPH